MMVPESRLAGQFIALWILVFLVDAIPIKQLTSCSISRRCPQFFAQSDHSKQHLTEQYFHAYKREEGMLQDDHVFWHTPFEREPENVDHLMKVLFQHLTSFSNATDFDVSAFESSLKTLRWEISVIESSIANFEKRLDFIQGVLQTMSRSLEIMNSYNVPEVPGEIYLRKMIELHTRAFSLYSPLGVPDSSSLHYADRVYSLWRGITFWVVKFDGLTDVPEEMQDMFKSQVAQAKEIVGILAKEIPEHDL